MKTSTQLKALIRNLSRDKGKRQIESVFIKKARHVSIMLGLKLCVFGKLQKSQIFATLET